MKLNNLSNLLKQLFLYKHTYTHTCTLHIRDLAIGYYLCTHRAFATDPVMHTSIDYVGKLLRTIYRNTEEQSISHRDSNYQTPL